MLARLLFLARGLLLLKNRMRHKRLNQGQVALEYAMAMTVVAGLAALLWLFYQGFILGSLYGGDPKHSGPLGLIAQDKAMGLEKVVSLPVP